MKRTFLSVLVGSVLGGALLFSFPANAKEPAAALATGLRLPALLSDNMVVQAGRSIPIWGWAKPGEAVSVQPDSGAVVTTTASKDGHWKVELPATEATEPFSITVTAGGKTIKITDILAGEVWLASGQSNMNWPLTRTENGSEEAKQADFPEIRLFHVSRTTNGEPQDDVKGRWLPCNTASVKGFSAVAYYFGKKVHGEINRPVGLIHSSWGGTPAEAWTPEAAFAAEPSLKRMLNRTPKAMQARLGNPSHAEAMKRLEEKHAEWRDQVYKKDPGNTGLERGWATVDFNDSEWPNITLPAMWQQAINLPDNGVLWFRRSIEIPEAWVGKDLMLELGAIDDFDITYFNGKYVGNTGEEPNHYQKPRIYRVPAKLVRAGRNVITVRVFDWFGQGGFAGEADEMRVSLREPTEGNDAKPLMLAGTWRYQVAHAMPQPSKELLRAEPRKPKDQSLPTALFNGMIAPITPLPLAGVIWYQGESNAGRAWEYRTLFPTMIKGWRAEFDQPELPFYFVQLANFGKDKPIKNGSPWAELREAQAMTTSLPHTGMAVTIDIGESDDIHPRNKRDVGYRLAALALRNLYNKDVPTHGPVLNQPIFDGKHAKLKFDTGGGKLKLAEGADSPTGFTLAGEDQVFHEATAIINGDNEIILTSPEVPRPVAVRYLWANDPPANLYNEHGFPAHPFRTDSWRGVTQPREPAQKAANSKNEPAAARP